MMKKLDKGKGRASLLPDDSETTSEHEGVEISATPKQGSSMPRSLASRLQCSAGMAAVAIAEGVAYASSSDSSKLDPERNALQRLASEEHALPYFPAYKSVPGVPAMSSLKDIHETGNMSEVYEQFAQPPRAGIITFDPGSSNTITHDQIQHAFQTSVRRQEQFDGQEVSLLLERSEDPETMKSIDETTLEKRIYGLSDFAAERLRNTLFRDNVKMTWDNVLNFTPNSLARNTGSSSQNREVRELLGLSNIATARMTWLEQWTDVLHSYTDHVWDDLSPLVMEARGEVGILTNLPPEHVAMDAPALERLTQILCHLRGAPQ